MTDTSLANLAIGIASASLAVNVLNLVIIPIVTRKLREKREEEERRRHEASRKKVKDHLDRMAEIKERETARLVTDSANYRSDTRTPGAPR